VSAQVLALLDSRDSFTVDLKSNPFGAADDFGASPFDFGAAGGPAF
jgi:hypothetical protein